MKRKVRSRQRFVDETGGDAMDEELRQDRFHAAGAQMLGASGRQIMPERVKAHGGGEGADEKTDKKAKKKDEDEKDEDDEFFSAEVVEDEPAKAAKGKTEVKPEGKAKAKAKVSRSAALTPPSKSSSARKGKKDDAVAGGGTGPDSAKKTKGRPSTDRTTLVLAALRTLQKSDGTSVKFFGCEWKNVNRNWTSYAKDIKSFLEECEDEEESEELVILLRTLQAARR